jgi:hypothetical protein
MSWPEPIKVLSLHDYELKHVDLTKQPCFEFALNGAPNVRLSLFNVRGLVANGMVWPQNVVLRASVFRISDFDKPAFGTVIQEISKNGFVDKRVEEHTRSDCLVITINASIGFELLAIVDSYTFETLSDTGTN